MKDEELFLSLIKKKWKLPLKTFKNPAFIVDEAKALGATISYSLLEIDFNFNKEGRLISINSPFINSTIFRGGSDA